MEAFDPFKVLGLERRYDVDPDEVERVYLERSAALHPDMTGDAEVAELAEIGGEDRIAALNRAKQVLTDPEQRAAALWRLWGGSEGVEDKSLPAGFLAEMMEVREEIEAARASADGVEMRKWEDWADARRREYQRTVGELFSRLAPGAASNAGVLRQVRQELNGWRYIERLLEQLQP